MKWLQIFKKQHLTFHGLQDLKDKLPKFKTAYYTFTFADDKSIYKFDHWDDAIKKNT